VAAYSGVSLTAEADAAAEVWQALWRQQQAASAQSMQRLRGAMQAPAAASTNGEIMLPMQHSA
jgi:hypothetical protein